MNNIKLTNDELITNTNGIIERWSYKIISNKCIFYKNKCWYLIYEDLDDELGDELDDELDD